MFFIGLGTGFFLGIITMAICKAASDADDFTESVYEARFRQSSQFGPYVDLDEKRETLPIARRRQRFDREMAARRCK